jgi:hypothetical protein
MRVAVLASTTRFAVKATRVTLIGTLSVLCGACTGDLCGRNSNDPPSEFSDGLTSNSATLYMTSEADAPYLDFPSGMRYRLFHELMNTPSLIVPYVSFSPTPLSDGSGFTVSPGNQTVINAVTDDYIEVENDTCTDFFLRVVASTEDFTPAPTVNNDADAGADGGN